MTEKLKEILIDLDEKVIDVEEAYMEILELIEKISHDEENRKSFARDKALEVLRIKRGNLR